jgi:ABC-2 type transport system ATP-binding protein
MYVREYLKYTAGIFKMKNGVEDRINEVIELTGLQIEQNKKIGALSKGYRQRVGLAQALIHDPDVLILDEPTTGLDPNQLVEIRELIKKIGKEKTVLLSTHIMQEVEAICDRVIIINKGKVVADEATAEMSKLLQSSEIISVEFDKEIKVDLLKKIEGIEHIQKIHSKLFEITAKEGKDIRKTLFNWAVKNEVQILSMNKKDSNLEHIFRQLTQKEK